MNHNNSQLNTSNGRGNIQSLVMGVASIAMIALGIYMVVELSNWIVLVLAIVFTLLTVVFYLNNKKNHRNDP